MGTNTEKTELLYNNKKAYFEYFLEDTFEAGIVLEGSEVKSIKDGHVSLADSFVNINNGEVFLKNAYVKNYEKTLNYAPNEKRNRKLLLNKTEISKLKKKTEEKGYTIIPTKIYLKNNLVKVQIALCKGKKLYDKRKTIKEREVTKSIERELKKF